MNPTFNELVNLMSEFHRMEMYKEEEKIKRVIMAIVKNTKY